MALREDEPVTIMILRIVDSQDFPVEGGEDVGDRECRAYVPDACTSRLIENDAANRPGLGDRIIRQRSHGANGS